MNIPFHTPFLNNYSVEVMPGGLDALETSLVALPAPKAVYIPSLPNDSFEGQLRSAIRIRQMGFEPVCHIAARKIGSAQALDQFLTQLSAEAGITSLFVIAGDKPHPAGPFDDALAVINSGLLAGRGLSSISFAGHPEGHPAIAEPALWQAMQDKADAVTAMGLRYEIVTQFAFDAHMVARWITAVRERGITAPIRIGVPGPAKITTLLRYAKVCGVATSSRAVAKYGFSLSRLLGMAGPDAFLADLADRIGGAAGDNVLIHLFPFGGFAEAGRWLHSHLPEHRPEHRPEHHLNTR
jgi:methylenetetrahydrofolate reductase (NADPH)